MQIKDTHDFDTIDVKSWVSQYTDNALIHSFINILACLYFAIPYFQVSTGEFVRCLSSLSRALSVGYPKGGSISIPRAYMKGITKYGGKVKTGISVKKIMIKGEKVRGVELDNGDIISSEIVISNAGIKETVHNLIGKSYFKKDYLENIEDLKYSMSAFTIKIALKKPITHHKIVIPFFSSNAEEKFKSIQKGNVPEDVDLFVPITSNFDPNLVPEGMQLITAGTAVPLTNFEKNKDIWLERSMRTLQNTFPELEKNILWKDITTPKDIEYMGGKEGAVIGISQSIFQSGINRPAIDLPIEGLYLVGGDAGGWGIGTEMAAKSAIECSEIILSQEK
jgi:prolycopene isomerase